MHKSCSFPVEKYSMVKSMPVSVKVYYGHGSTIEIRRFVFRSDVPPQPQHHNQQRSSQAAVIHPYSSHFHQQQSVQSSSSHLFKSEQITNISIYETLLDKIRSLYNGLNLQEMHLCWKDDDGDYVVFSSDDELRVAINSTSDNTLRIYIKEKEIPFSSRTGRRVVVDVLRRSCGDLSRSDAPKHVVRERDLTPSGSYRRRREAGDMEPDLPESPTPAPSSSSCAIVNHVTGNDRVCSECQGEGRGVWYKCTVCNDFYICSDCEHQGLHDQHIMVRTTTGPQQSTQNNQPK